MEDNYFMNPNFKNIQSCQKWWYFVTFVQSVTAGALSCLHKS